MTVGPQICSYSVLQIASGSQCCSTSNEILFSAPVLIIWLPAVTLRGRGSKQKCHLSVALWVIYVLVLVAGFDGFSCRNLCPTVHRLAATSTNAASLALAASGDAAEWITVTTMQPTPRPSVRLSVSPLVWHAQTCWIIDVSVCRRRTMASSHEQHSPAATSRRILLLSVSVSWCNRYNLSRMQFH